MRRFLAGTIEVILYAAVAALLLTVVITATVRQRGWTRDTAQKVLAQELANALGQPVRVGPIEGDVWRGLTIRGLAVTGPSGRDDIIVEEATVEWDLAAVIRGKPLPQTIRRIVVTRPYVRVAQDEAGHTNVDKLLRLLLKPVAKPGQPVPPWLVEVRDGMIEYDLRGPKIPDRPMVGRVYGINVTADLRRENWVLATAHGRSDSALIGGFDLTMGMQRPLGAAGVRVGFQRLGLPTLVRLAGAQGKLQVESGTADGEVMIYQAPGGKPQVAASFFGSGLGVRIPKLGGTIRAGSAEVRVTSHGLWASMPRVDFDGGSGDVELSVSDFTKPAIDLQVTQARLYWPRIQALALKNVKSGKMPQIKLGWVTGKVAVMGPTDHLEVDAQVAAADGVEVTTEKKTTVAAAGATIQAALHDSAKPAVVFDVTLKRPRIDNVPAVKWGDTKQRPVVRGMTDTRVTGSTAGSTTVATARVGAAQADFGRIGMRSLAGRVEVAWPVVHVASLTLDAGGGRASIEALAAGDGSSVAARGQFHDVQTAWIGRAFAPKWKHEIKGVAAGQLAVKSQNKATEVDVLAKVANVQYEDYRARNGALEFKWNRAGVSVPWFVAQTDAGPVAGDVTVDAGARTFTVRYSAGPLDMAEAGKEVKAEGWSGTMWARGRVGGSYDKPTLEATVAASHPGKEDQQADAAFAKVEGDMQELHVPVLMAAREGAVASFTGTLRDVKRDTPWAEIDGKVVAKGIEVERALKWAKAKQETLPKGPAEIEATVTGTVAKPEATGQVRAGPVAWKDYYASRLEGPFKFTMDRVEVGPGTGVVEGAPVSFTAEVTDLGKEKTPAHVTVLASTGEFQLSRLAALQRRRIEAYGRAQVSEAKVEFTGDKLQYAQAKVSLGAWRFGQTRFEPATLKVWTEGNLVVLAPAAITWPAGRMQVSGNYDTDKRTVTAEVRGEKCEVGTLLSGGADTLPATMKDGEDLRKAMRNLDSWGLRLVGPVTGTVRITGSVDEPELAVRLEKTALKLDGRKLPETTVKCVYVPKDRAFRDINLEALYGQGLIIAKGSMEVDGNANLMVDASSLDLRRLREWFPAVPSASGVLEFACQLKGKTKRPDVRGDFVITDFAVSGARFDLVQVPIFTIKEGALSIDTGVLKRDEHEINVAGELPFTWEGPKIPTDGPVALKASASAVNVELLQTLAAEYYRSTYPQNTVPAVLRAETSGVVDGMLDIGGTLSAPKINGGLTVGKMAVKMPGWAKPMHDVTAKLTMQPAGGGTLVTVEKGAATYDKTAMVAGGEVLVRSLTKGKMVDNDWNLWFTAASAEEVVEGGTRLKNLRARVEVKNGGPGVVRVEVVDGRAQLGPGTAVVKGGVDLGDLTWAKLAENRFDVSVALRNAQVKYGEQLDGYVDGTLSVANPGPKKAAVLGGRVTLSKAAISMRSTGVAAPELYGAPPTAPNFGFNVECYLGQGVSVKGGGLEMPLQSGLKLASLTGTMEEPVVRGRVEAQQGRATLPGGILSVKTLDVDLKLDPDRSKKGPNGGVALVYKAEVVGQAERIVSQVEVDGQIVGPVHIYLAISGELPGTLTVKATSEPSLAEEQIYAILGAEPLGVLPTGGTSTSEALSERFVSLLALGLRASVFEPVEAQLRQLFGLSEFAITFGLTQTAEVRIGKYLVKNLLVSYQRSLVSTGSVEDWWLSVSYEVAPGSVVSYYARSDGDKRFMVGRRKVF